MDPVKVLLVEDHADTRNVLAKIIRAAGFHVVVAVSVGDALAKLDGQAFALLDFNLPDGEGTIVFEHIRQQPHKTKVAFITAMHDPRQFFHERGIDADGVFQKPFNFDALLKWLREPV